MILMPRFMKGLLKSITRSRRDVIVSGAIAKSASCKHTHTGVNAPSHRPPQCFRGVYTNKAIVDIRLRPRCCIMSSNVE